MTNHVAAKPTLETNKSKHFVLVHGACHGAWSWYKVMAKLRSSSDGHRVTAIDLGASGIDPHQPNDLSSISDHFKPLTEFMESLDVDERVVLVGHSFGGLAVSQAMQSFPHHISVAVFVTALMPGPNLNISTLNKKSSMGQESQMDNRFTYSEGPNSPPTTFLFGPQYLASRVYHRSPPQDLELASVLIRPLPLFSEEDMSRELMLSENKYGSVNRVFIVAENDMVNRRDFQWWMIERNQPNDVLEITGSDHMVMMSKPLDLYIHLKAIAEKYSY
ncbi:hypothetical protein FNV43_RR22775 [Rhamnella rubrinervis]|uniref:(S)-hydroxynitrile lyase n=1 Tax=Rhamnella rubrinervis TaxID=2594499 RepID=A0A8K0GRF4_9ROSA|nr:hypothetical protein FNV43_RR22775 [Rhamnella rubrinervis]